MDHVPVLIISGPVGVGKTSVALEIVDLLQADGPPLAVVDFDALTWCFPRPPDDRFHQRLGLRNRLRRTLELAAELEEARAEDYVVETDGRTVTEVARAVLEAAGWWPVRD